LHVRTFSGRTARLRYRPSFQMAAPPLAGHTLSAPLRRPHSNPGCLLHVDSSSPLCDRIGRGCIDRDSAHRKRDRQRTGAKEPHDPECARAEGAKSGPDTKSLWRSSYRPRRRRSPELSQPGPAGQPQTASARRRDATGRTSNHAGVARAPLPGIVGSADDLPIKPSHVERSLAGTVPMHRSAAATHRPTSITNRSKRALDRTPHFKRNSGGCVIFGWNCALQDMSSQASHIFALRLIASGK
jgi:hypothetical protein